MVAELDFHLLHLTKKKLIKKKHRKMLNMVLPESLLNHVEPAVKEVPRCSQRFDQEKLYCFLGFFSFAPPGQDECYQTLVQVVPLDHPVLH